MTSAEPRGTPVARSRRAERISPAAAGSWPPSGSGVAVDYLCQLRLRAHRSSKAHLPTSAPFPGQPHGLVSGRLCPGSRRRGRDRSPGFPVAFRRPAFASWASCSRQRDSALLTVGLPGSAWTLAGLPRFAHLSHGRIGCPLYPEAQRCSHGRSDPSGRRSPPSSRGQALSPRHAFHLPELSITRRHRGFTHVHPPGLPPRLLALDGTGPLGLAPRASHPGRQDLRGARQGRGRTSSTRPELYARHQHRTSFR